MSTIEIRKIGITNLAVDAIVNAANEGLWAGGGVCGAIFEVAGKRQLQKACDAIGHCDTGSAVITPAFNLSAKYIIHAVGPRWSGGMHHEPQLLYSAYRKSLELALENDCHSIGFPLLSAGIFGYPADKAWRKAIQACQDFLSAHQETDMQIIFAVIDDRMLALGRETLRDLNPTQVTSDKLLIKGALRDAVFFHLPEEPNGYLSNWYPAEFTIDGVTFSSTEQYIMYRKCKIFGDEEAASAILETNDPAKQQAIGQGANGFDSTIWNGMKQVVAYRGLLAKFSQNENLKQQLLDTGNAYLVECAHKDIIWACGIRLTEEERFDISKWRGQNILGFALMEVRNTIRPKASALFEEKPFSWGLRGDPFFWDYLKVIFNDYLLPMDGDALEQIIISQFEQVSGCKLTEEVNPPVERFAHGGMSSGQLSGIFWVRHAIPLLKNRCREIIK